ncbi:MAG: SUF system Fe-S cluster assembly protein [Saprospirales bacterium]|nr:SUF system Fe-S cluster assembly protein [Saprospirales bacterium]|tara:strand:+ start:11310 stop:11615 length:306 start_codon:yes stop_codon:yes gene_type:complete
MEHLKNAIIEQIKTIFDPEIPVNIYALGLIYEVNVDEKGQAEVIMTLTSPACPVAGSLPGEVEEVVMGVDGVEDAVVELVFDPPWDKEMMSDEAKFELGFD